MLVSPRWRVLFYEEERQLEKSRSSVVQKMWSAFVFLCQGSIRVGVPVHARVSHRRFSENLLPPLATFPTTSLHHTTLVLICIRFTCPRCYSEGQEDGLVVPHADVGSNVIINY